MRIGVLLVVGVLGVIPETFTPQEKQLALEKLSKNLFKSTTTIILKKTKTQ